MSELLSEPTANTDASFYDGEFVRIDQQQYSNGAFHLYGVDAQGKKHHLSSAQLLADQGYSEHPKQQATLLHGEQSPIATDMSSENNSSENNETEDAIKAHARWQLKVDTTPMETGAKPSKNGLTGEDMAYAAWLKENAGDAHEGQSLLEKRRKESEANQAAERLQRLRDFARLEMRVNTGVATGEEAAYYYTLKENAEKEAAAVKKSEDEIAEARQRAEMGDLTEDLLEKAWQENEIFDVYDEAKQMNREYDAMYDHVADMARRVDTLRHDFVDATAQRRRAIFGMKGAKKSLLDEASRAFSSALDEWLAARVSQSIDLRKKYNVKEADKESVESITRAAVLSSLVGQTYVTEGLIRDRRVQLAGNKRLSWFYDKWAKWSSGNDGLTRGKLKKIGVMLGVGLASGAAAAFVIGTAGIGGGIIGAAAASSLGAGVTRGWARGKIQHESVQTTVAGHQAEVQARDIEASIQTKLADAATKDPLSLGSDMVDSINQHTRAELNRNRRRMMGSVAIGAAAGVVGGELGHLAHEAVFGGGGSHIAPSHPNVHHGAGSNHHHPSAKHGSGHNHGNGNPTGRELQPQNKAFRVENGSGIIREVSEYAQSRGHHISPERAQEIYNHLHAKFGRNIVNLNGSHDTYMVGSDVRLSHPGMAHWYPGVEHMLDQELSKH